MARACHNLTPTEYADLLGQGYVLVSGPHATESECLSSCQEQWFCMGAPTSPPPPPPPPPGPPPPGEDCSTGPDTDVPFEYSGTASGGEEAWWHLTGIPGGAYHVSVATDGGDPVVMAVWALCSGGGPSSAIHSDQWASGCVDISGRSEVWVVVGTTGAWTEYTITADAGAC